MHFNLVDKQIRFCITIYGQGFVLNFYRITFEYVEIKQPSASEMTPNTKYKTVREIESERNANDM